MHSTTSRTPLLRVLAASAAALTLLTLPACSAAEPTGAGAGGELTVDLSEFLEPLDAYPVPTEPVEDVASLEGKTVYYIPITQQSPQFGVTGPALAEALGTVGIDVQTCNGNGTPTDISACLNQAVNQGAVAIVADAISYAMAANAFDAARAAEVPVIIGNQVPDPEHPADETLAYLEGDAGAAMQVALARWVAQDSGGTANVLINQSVDGKSPGVFVDAGEAEYAEICPDCKVTINEVTSANFSMIPSSTSSALLQNPDVTYVESQFAQYLQPTQTGVQQSGRTGSIKGLTGSAQVGALQALESENFLAAASGQASAYRGWAYGDAVLRLALGTELPEYTVPVRLFTADNIGDVTLTEEAEASGEWFGPATFRDDFTALWGAQ
ncbi:monosaccharide ABC transporter substrate-binding protein (CUT2 family) [Promicromonospora sp. AC04]|uniref:sugar ABC transporter substrate-binding protein n=1 Tax=Promicromonospora sp. AC04 TaxID=2135723 RepID=UPI000D3B1018|nr:substrate-binding domain-containing protein [Promicromonospora sp. AC04]PUB32299.1 monosaccharide ABC transporter substrate-binding protein (CUT2 family) [Promicromonospora sp. AC04]